MHSPKLFFVVACWLYCSLLSATEIPIWKRWELTLQAGGEAKVDPNAQVSAEITSPSGKKQSINGFWDGDRVWKVRFMPNEIGNWSYIISSKPEMSKIAGEKGTFECIANKGTDRFSKHGSIRVAKSGTYLEHADGTPFFWVGDTVWNATVYSTKEDWAKFLQDRNDKHFSVMQFVTLAPWRIAPQDPDGRTAYKGSKEIEIDPKFFKRLDERIEAINEIGFLAAPVLIWAHKKGDPGIDLPEADILKICKYQIARYGAYQVVWILAGRQQLSRQRNRKMETNRQSSFWR